MRAILLRRLIEEGTLLDISSSLLISFDLRSDEVDRLLRETLGKADDAVEVGDENVSRVNV